MMTLNNRNDKACPKIHQINGIKRQKYIWKYGRIFHFYQIIKKQKQSFADVLQNRCSYNFSKFRSKTLVLELMFNEFGGLHTFSIFIKRILQHRCFPMKFMKILRTPFFTEHIRRLILWKNSL